MTSSLSSAIIEFKISGLHCNGCVGTAQRALAAVPGVRTAEVDLATGKARVEVESNFKDASALDRAITAAGYETDIPSSVSPSHTPSHTHTPLAPASPASPPSPPLAPLPPPESRIRLRIEGLSCASCVSKVEHALKAVPGVARAEVNFATHRASVAGAPGLAASALEAAVTRAGYRAERIAPEEETDPAEAIERDRQRTEAENAQWRQQFIVSAAVSAVLMAFASVHELRWAHGAMATGLQIYAGARFYLGAARSLRAGSANMDSLIAIGTTAAWGQGVWRLLYGDGHAAHDFMTAAMLLAFISLGKWLEGRGRLKAGRALKTILELAPAVAHRIENGAPRDMDSKLLRPGDLCRVLEGERIPADGILLEGGAEVDESMLTGESLPAAKKPGDEVYGGTVNAGGAFTMTVERVGAETALRGIARRVEEAQTTRPRMQALADKVSAVFVPAVLVIAALTLGGSLAAGLPSPVAISRAVAVLIVACPCALGLATPLAVMAGVGAAARRGMIVRSAETLEISREIDTVVFDKTGTLTMGKPEVTGLYPAPGEDEHALLDAAASLEAESKHPLARAILAAARTQGILPRPLAGVQSIIGSGIKSDSPALALGSAEFLRTLGIPAEVPSEAVKRQGRGETIIAVGVPGGRLLGAIALADQLKPGAAEAVTELKSMGLKTALLSGDSEAAAKAIASLVGIENSRGRVAPGHKADAVREMQQAGARLAMVGDGINDAPALAQAELGIAMAAGSDVAQEAAGLVLLSGDPRQVGAAIRLARRVRRTMVQNLAWAFIYNVALIPLAALGLLEPIFASAAMAFSSASVVGNALRLNRYRD